MEISESVPSNGAYKTPFQPFWILFTDFLLEKNLHLFVMPSIQKYQYFVASLCSFSPSASGVKLTACYFPTNRASHQVPLFSGGVTSDVMRALRHVSLSVTLSVLSPGERSGSVSVCQTTEPRHRYCCWVNRPHAPGGPSARASAFKTAPSGARPPKQFLSTTRVGCMFNKNAFQWFQL